jgi:hypothetical protein
MGKTQFDHWKLFLGANICQIRTLDFFSNFLINRVWINQAKSWKCVMFKTLLWQPQWFQICKCMIYDRKLHIVSFYLGQIQNSYTNLKGQLKSNLKIQYGGSTTDNSILLRLKHENQGRRIAGKLHACLFGLVSFFLWDFHLKRHRSLCLSTFLLEFCAAPAKVIVCKSSG